MYVDACLKQINSNTDTRASRHSWRRVALSCTVEGEGKEEAPAGPASARWPSAASPGFAEAASSVPARNERGLSRAWCCTMPRTLKTGDVGAIAARCWARSCQNACAPAYTARKQTCAKLARKQMCAKLALALACMSELELVRVCAGVGASNNDRLSRLSLCLDESCTRSLCVHAAALPHKTAALPHKAQVPKMDVPPGNHARSRSVCSEQQGSGAGKAQSSERGSRLRGGRDDK
eukprot:539997-Pleurochrysis_carterae.AAC.2